MVPEGHATTAKREIVALGPSFMRMIQPGGENVLSWKVVMAEHCETIMVVGFSIISISPVTGKPETSFNVRSLSSWPREIVFRRKFFTLAFTIAQTVNLGNIFDYN